MKRFGVRAAVAESIHFLPLDTKDSVLHNGSDDSMSDDTPIIPPETTQGASSGQPALPESTEAPQTVPSQSVDDAPDEKPFGRVSVRQNALNDLATQTDRLGFRIYVRALASFLLHRDTRAPLTLSIEGAWGSGKSSFMLMLKQLLERPEDLQLSDKPDRAITIRFNAWQYDVREEMWAAFALTLIGGLRAARPWYYLPGLRLLWARADDGWKKLRLLSYAGILVASLPLLAFQFAGTGLWGSLPNAAAGALSILSIWKLGWKFRENRLDLDLEKYIDDPDYKGRISFLDSFQSDFKKVVRAYVPHRTRVFVLVDDLDRCEPPKAADLMQAINLMIGEQDRIFFLIGLDRERVAAAIAFKYRAMIRHLSPPPNPRAFGNEYLEKFIQLTFRIPVPRDDELAKEFIDSLVEAAPEEPDAGQRAISPGHFAKVHRRAMEILERVRKLAFQSIRLPGATSAGQRRETAAAIASSDVGHIPEGAEMGQRSPGVTGRSSGRPFRETAITVEWALESDRVRRIMLDLRSVLDHNPRRIKTFLNLYRLAVYVADQQALLKDSDSAPGAITPEQLGAFLAITYRYPEILDVMARDAAERGELGDSAVSQDPESLFSIGTLSLDARREIRPSELYKPWLLIRSVSSLLRRPQYSLYGFPFWAFTSILPAVPFQSSSTPPRQQSGDTMEAAKSPTRSSSDARALDNSRIVGRHRGPVSAIDWSLANDLIASGADDGTLQIWDPHERRRLRSLVGPTGWVIACSWSPSGDRIIAGSSSHVASLWDTSTWRLVRTLAGHENRVSTCSWSPRGDLFVSGSWDQTLRVWDATNGASVRELHGHQAAIASCAWSPAGDRIVSGDLGGSIRIWDANSGNCIRTVEGDGTSVNAAAWSPDGRLLATTAGTNKILLWAADTLEHIGELVGHTAEICTCRWSPDGRHVVSGSEDATLRVWDVQERSCEVLLRGHDDHVLSAGWSPGGDAIASGSRDGTVRLWDISSVTSGDKAAAS